MRGMTYNKMTNEKTVPMCLMVCAVLVFLAVSLVFTGLEATHECEDHDCPVCEMLHQCAVTVKHVFHCTGLKTVAVLMAVFFAAIPVFRRFLIVSDTPVTEKIRLND